MADSFELIVRAKTPNPLHCGVCGRVAMVAPSAFHAGGESAVCPVEHRLFIPPFPTPERLGEEAADGWLDGTDNDDGAQVRRWLSDPWMCKSLHPQLAEVLRELVTTPATPLPRDWFRRCPLCGDPLSTATLTTRPRREGLTCAQGHEWTTFAWYATTIDIGFFQIQPAFLATSLASRIAMWLEPEPLQRYLPESLRRLLLRLQSTDQVHPGALA